MASASSCPDRLNPMTWVPMNERDLPEYQMSDDSETEWETVSGVDEYKPWWEPTEDDYRSWGGWWHWCPRGRESWYCSWDPWRDFKNMSDEEKALEIDGWLQWKEWSDKGKRKRGEEWLKQQGMEITEENNKLLWPPWQKVKPKERSWLEFQRSSYKKELRSKLSGRPPYADRPLPAPVWPKGTDPDKRT